MEFSGRCKPADRIIMAQCVDHGGLTQLLSSHAFPAEADLAEPSKGERIDVRALRPPHFAIRP
jgi:hypothetical protein